MAEIKYRFAQIILCALALASVAFVCEVYLSLDDSRFDLGNCANAVAVALLSLGPTH